MSTQSTHRPFPPAPLRIDTVPLRMPMSGQAGPSSAGSTSSSMSRTQGARSSRRRNGGNGPAVILGGGVGHLGSRMADGSSGSTPSPTSSRSTVSPTSSGFYTPTLISPVNTVPGERRSPSAIVAAQPVAIQSQSQSQVKPKSRSTSRAGSVTPTMTNPSLPEMSNSSLASASSSSSRTLKTPISKLDAIRSPEVSSASSSASHRQNTRPKEAEGSPTPQRTISEKSRPMRSPPPPPRAQLPSVPVEPVPVPPLQLSTKAAPSGKPLNAARARLPPGEIKKEHRLSQDWISISALEIPQLPASAQTQSNSVPDQRQRARSTSPLPATQPESSVPNRAQTRLPPPMMVPLKSQVSPSRPSFERNHSAPLSPTRQVRPEYQTRASFDQLQSRSRSDSQRDGSPTPPSRTRVSSFSTPPQDMFDRPDVNSSSSTKGRLNMFKTGTSASKPSPPLRTRRSEDMLRKSEDMLRPTADSYTKKELKAMQREAQRNLGVATPTPVAVDREDTRKASGLSLKKSSGALKALFKSKGKEKDSTPPPMPTFSRAASETVTGMKSSAQASGSASPSQASTASEFGERRSLQTDRAVSQPTGRASFAAERALYPSHPKAKEMAGRRSEDWARSARNASPIPQRDPSPSPISRPQPGTNAVSTPMNVPSTGQAVDVPKQPLLGEALPTSSLPYLSAMAGVSRSLEESPVISQSGRMQSSKYPSAEASPKPSGEAPQTPSPLFKPSKSLHLLALPDLDLDFDLSFDKVGNSSPGTPRKLSPRRTPRPGMSGFASPTRSLSTSSKATARPSPIKRTASSNERRRSQSFDGSASGPDIWADGSGFGLPTRLFGSSTSSSAPLLSMSLEPTTTDGTQTHPEQAPHQAVGAYEPATTSSHLYSQSFSSQPSAPSSSDHAHARTPSNASSTNETSTPSPPRTPVEEKSLSGLGLGDFDQQPEPANSFDKKVMPTVAPASTVLAPPIELSFPPSIPLPALPAIAPVEREEKIVVEPIKSDKDLPELTKPRTKVWSLHSRGKMVTPELSLGNRALSREIDRLLLGFRYPSHGTTAMDRMHMLKSDLLPLLLEIDRRPYDPKDELAYSALRHSLFEWADALMFELQIEQSANERGACLEALATVIESTVFSERAFKTGRVVGDEVRFTGLMMRVMGFVMAKLGAKGVFHNTLLFSGRILAFAFFRIPHISEQLVTVLQPPRGALMRFTRAAMMGPALPASAQPRYPAHLLPLCFDNTRAYTARLATLSPEFASTEERDAFLFQPGNWLRRWQSDDSELFPAFYRSYHRQLAQYLAPAIEYFESHNQPLPPSVLLRAPGYAHLATIFAKKCQSYILGSVNAVTTSSAAPSFEATETAGFRGSQKPPVLETANRRLVETISTFIHSRMMVTDTRGRIVEYAGASLWTGMVDLWTKSIISKTSLFAPKGVFSLFDLLDGIVDPPYDPLTGSPTEAILDVPHLIYTIRIILTQAEHALTLVKAIAFVFTHWEVLTANADDRRELCLDLLLKKELFDRLCLFWSQSVRSYVLRLVVFRLGHIHTKKEDGIAHDVEIESVQLLQTRLDKIRRRYDQLEPRSNESDSDMEVNNPLVATAEGGLTRSRSTITMVADSLHLGSGSANKAEKLLGLGMGLGEKDEDGKKAANGNGKASSWFKKFGGKSKKKGSSTPPTRSPALEPSALLPSTDAISPIVRNASRLAAPPSPPIGSPATSSESAESGERELQSRSDRKAPPPTILTTSPPTPGTAAQDTSSTSFAFEFELPTTSPRSDNFDPVCPPSPRRNSQPPSPNQPTSPHMSRSFSKRSSLLPPQTARELDNMLANGVVNSPNATGRDASAQETVKKMEEVGYDKRLHPYAVRMLAELEDAQKEYDEWWSEGGVGKMDGAPPRLTVAWPFHEGEE